MNPSQNTSTPSRELDAAELTHLAIKALRQKRDDDALAFLRRAIERDPNDAKPYVLIGGILASNRQYAEAIQAMTRAVALDPQLWGARFQLGLLHFTSGDVPQARSVWQALDDLDENHPLRLFKTGMLHIANWEFDQCVATIERGIARCDTPSLNKDMRLVIDKAKAAGSAHSSRSHTPQQNSLHVMAARYQRAMEEKKKS